MKGNLPNREPGWLARWQTMDIYGRLREKSKDREQFILHDGPPYANGNIHIGHALNKILKDVIVRARQMSGYNAVYVPGWDCHGLPIEWKIEEKYRKKKKSKDEVPLVEFRRECREFAAKWIDVQREEFKRLGIFGDWDNPYLTMDYAAEAQIVRELHKFLMNGSLYRGSKPVMWSVVEKTALAEAEVEYHTHTSHMVDVAFPVVKPSLAELEGADIVIWTTTPWTLPGNRAIAYGAEIDYVVIEVAGVAEDSRVRSGRRLVVAEALLEEMRGRCGITEFTTLTRFKGAALEGSVCHHPWHGKGYDFDVPLLPGAHVTTEAGTGFVHTAPGHGQEDYEVGLEFGLEVPFTVDDGGRYYDHVPLFAGDHVFKVHDRVCEELEKVDALLARDTLEHSYPHSWRSKAPLIFRNTPQWFISMETNGLRDKALKAIGEVRWIPDSGERRITAMVESRPDWVISRQRAWGVPIAVFVNKQSGELLRDEAVNARIAEAVAAEGADAWFDSDPSRFLGNDYAAEEYEQVMDILDVWFDSGSTHSFVLEDREDLRSPADLYLEGTDQHRGWFQSSLLESCGTRGHAPYKAVLTHGFTLDEKGMKMSKSLGNGIEPQAVVKQYGADILRLWVTSTDYFNDHRIGENIIKGQVEAYRKIRNTLRFLLGNLAGFEETERLSVAEMPELDRWVLHRLSELDALVRDCVENYNFHRMYNALYNFCIVDLSAFYFDIRKDALYCDARASARRRAARTVLDAIFHCLTRWLAPILVFTAEEVWQARFPDEADSVHLKEFYPVPADWHDAALAEKWVKIRHLRRVVTGALEVERREKRIGSSLQAAVRVYVDDPAYGAALEGVDLAELSITSAAELVLEAAPEGAFRLEDVAGVAVVSTLAEGQKCERCWQVLPEVGNLPGHEDICGRCAEAVEALDIDLPEKEAAAAQNGGKG